MSDFIIRFDQYEVTEKTEKLHFFVVNTETVQIKGQIIFWKTGAPLKILGPGGPNH